MSRRLWAAGSLLCAVFTLSACGDVGRFQTSSSPATPTTVKPARTVAQTPAAEREHERILSSYGGSYDDPKLEGLIGKTVGYPRATGGHLYFIRYVKKYGLPVDKIKVKFLQAPEMIAALERRDIDAFFLWEPWLTKAAELVKGAHVMARSGDDNVFVLVSYNYYSQGLLNDPPRALAATRALMEATDYCAANLDEAARITGKAFRIPEADMKLYMSRMVYRMEMPKDVVLTNFREAAELAQGEGIIKKMPDWSDFVRPGFMKEAAPDRSAGW